MTRASIGALRTRLAVEKPVPVPDGGGGADTQWHTQGKAWARIEAIGATRQLIADAVAGRVTHRIVVRRRAGLQPGVRLRQRDRVFLVLAALEAGPRDRLALLCEERTLST